MERAEPRLTRGVQGMKTAIDTDVGATFHWMVISGR